MPGEDACHRPRGNVVEWAPQRARIDRQDLRASDLPERDRKAAAQHVSIDLPDSFKFRRREIGLRPGALVRWECIGERAVALAPYAAFDAWGASQSGTDHVGQLHLKFGRCGELGRAAPAAQEEGVVIANLAASARDDLFGAANLCIGGLAIKFHQQKCSRSPRRGKHYPKCKEPTAKRRHNRLHPMRNPNLH